MAKTDAEVFCTGREKARIVAEIRALDLRMEDGCILPNFHTIKERIAAALEGGA